MHLEYLTTFCSLIENNCSLKTTASACNTTPIVIKKRLRNLELQLGQNLVYSRNKQLNPTEMGMRVYERIKLHTIFLNNTINDIKNEQETIRLSSTQTFITCWHKNFLNGFFQKYPKIEVIGIDKPIDLVQNNHDIFIGSLTDEIGRNQIHKRLLCNFHLMLCASTEYLEKAGNPKTVDELQKHRLICYPDDHYIYTFRDPNHLYKDISLGENYIKLNGGYNIVQAIENGWGIGPISIESAMSSKANIVPILPKIIKPQQVDVYCFSRGCFDSDTRTREIFATIKEDVDKQLAYIDEKYENITGTPLDR